ncbi:MAG: cell division protein FtsB [Gammaproteobacteria bacterium]|nr:cell division protein FtsB [Gammaproteobacteria bacterium]
MKMILAVLIVVLLSLQYKLWLGDGGVIQAHRIKARCLALEAENAKLQQRNHAIEADIVSLKSGGQALEEQARSELGMVKHNEEYYQFVD